VRFPGASGKTLHARRNQLAVVPGQFAFERRTDQSRDGFNDSWIRLALIESIDSKQFPQHPENTHYLRNSSVGIALGYGLDDRGFESRQGLGIFFFIVSRPALGPSQPSIGWVPGALFLGIKRPGHEADHSTPLLLYFFMAWCLVKHRDNFTFYLIKKLI
jgi:hypothetical protein